MAFASGQAQWLRELAGQDWVQAIRADGQRNLLAIARTVALWADWHTLESRPTWEQLIQASGLSARSVARWLLELRLRGWLELIEHGSTPATRPTSLADVEGNRAAVYGLRLPLTPERAAAVAAELMLTELATELDHLDQALSPAQAVDQPELSPVEESGTPSWSFRSIYERSKDGSSRARKPVDKSGSQVPDQGKQRMTALRAGSDEQSIPDLLIIVPVSRYEMLACADGLRRAHPLFGRCSRKLVRSLCRPYWRAGWCNRDILHALEHRPSMFAQVRRLSAPECVVSPRQLIASRLSAWRDESGRVRPGWWTAHTAQPVTGAGSRARQRVRARHGQAGARLLRAGEHALSVERIAAHGRAVRLLGSDGSHRPTEAQVSGERGARERLRAELLRQAHAALARDHDEPTGTGKAAAPGGAATPPVGGVSGSVHERALARARAEGHLPHRRRGRKRWT